MFGFRHDGQSMPQQEERRSRQIRNEVKVWALLRDAKEAFNCQQLTNYQEQELGFAISEAFKAGEEAERKRTKERDENLAKHMPWPFA